MCKLAMSAIVVASTIIGIMAFRMDVYKDRLGEAENALVLWQAVADDLTVRVVADREAAEIAIKGAKDAAREVDAIRSRIEALGKSDDAVSSWLAMPMPAGLLNELSNTCGDNASGASQVSY